MQIFKSIIALLFLVVAVHAVGAQTAPLSANKNVVRKFYETYGTRHDVEGCLPLFDPSAFKVVMTGMPEANLEGFKQLGIDYLKAFPDLKMTIERLIAEGDQVAVLVRFTGTHQGALMGIPPTGKKVDLLSTDIWTVRNGKLAGMQSVLDNMGLLQQLGVIPAK